jgi:hypothetical protein
MAASSSGTRTVRRLVLGATVLGVVAAYGVVAPSLALGASLTGSDFEIDANANLVVDDGGIDWLDGGSGSDMRSDALVKPDRPTGQGDDAFTQGTNINDTPTTITTGSIPNNKSDLTNFGIYVDKQSSETYVNVVWTRVQAPNGTTTMDFEFNQSSARQNGISPPSNPDVDKTTIPLRTSGDILITYFLENGGTHPTLTRRTWNGSAWGTAQAFSSSQALAAINTSSISAASSDGLGPLDALTFGEASVKLSALVPSSDTCTTFGSVYLRSRSSATDTDENKDFIAPEDVTISNCGSVTVHKTDANGALQGAGFTLYKDVSPVGGSAAGVEDKTVANTVDTCTTDSSGNCSFTNVKKGDYWVVETTVPAAHDAAADQHVSITAGDQVVPLSFVDPIQHGTITVTKDAVPDDAQDFTFSLDGSSFSLDDDANGTLPNTRSFTVVVGTHSLSETNIPSGWLNTGLTCEDPTDDTTTDAPSATVHVAKNETVTCTYENTYQRTAPGLSTTASAHTAGASWDDTATLTGDGTHAVQGSVAFYVCGPAASATACASTANKVGDDVAVSNGSATTSEPFTPSTAGWYCFRAVFTSSSPYYSGAAHSNDTTECFLKRNAALTVSKTATAAFGRAYTWDVEKAVVGDSHVDVPAGESHSFDYDVTVTHTQTDNAWTVTGDITVTNPNGVAFTGVDVSDAIDNGAGACSVPGGVDVTVPADDSVVLGYTCTYGSEPAPAAGTNTATATWDGDALFTATSSATGTANVDFSDVTPSTTDQVVTVTDSLAGDLGTLDGATAESPKVYSYALPQTAPEGDCKTVPNTASVMSVHQVGEASLLSEEAVTLDSSTAEVSLCGGLPLTVAQTPSGSFDRTFAWGIDKTVDRTRVTVDGNGTADFAYTVTVTPAGVSESGHALGGTVSVTNPNLWEDVVADITATADLGGGVTCTVADGEDATIPKGETKAFAYACAFASAPALSGTVTATATWDAEAAATTAADTDATEPVELALGAETNKTITVVDDKTDPEHPVTLGTWSYDDGEHDFTYTLTKSAVVGTCTDFTNVASIVETEQSDSQVVTLCGNFTGGGGGPVVTPPQGGGLPFTGAGLGVLLRQGLALLLAGLALLLVSRRWRASRQV